MTVLGLALAATAYIFLSLAFGFSESKAGKWTTGVGWTAATLAGIAFGLWLAVNQ